MENLSPIHDPDRHGKIREPKLQSQQEQQHQQDGSSCCVKSNYLVFTHPKTNSFGSQYVGYRTVASRGNYADLLSYGPGTIGDGDQAADELAGIYVADCHGVSTMFPSSSEVNSMRRPLRKDDLPMLINRKYILILKEEYEELLRLRKVTRADSFSATINNDCTLVPAASSMTSMEVDETTTSEDKTAKLEQQRPSITAITTVAAPVARKIRKRCCFGNVVTGMYLNKDDLANGEHASCYEDDDDDVIKDPDWDYGGSGRCREGPPHRRRRRLDRSSNSDHGECERADQVPALLEQRKYPSMPAIEDEDRLRMLFRLECMPSAVKFKKGIRSYSSKTERNMIRLILGTALRLTEAYSEHFWRKEWCHRNLVALKDNIKQKNLCDKMRRLVRSRYSSKGKAAPGKDGAMTTILEKRLHVIGFTGDEVMSISEVLRLGTEPKNGYEKWLENNVVASCRRKFLSDYIDSQISAIVTGNQYEMPINEKTSHIVGRLTSNPGSNKEI